MEIAIGVLGIIVAGQWILIWRLTDRLLMQANIPKLGPVRIAAPNVAGSNKEPGPPDDKGRKLFRIHVQD